jgi:hypothetical protein
MGPKVSRRVLQTVSRKVSQKMSPKMLHGFWRACCASLMLALVGLIGEQPAAAAPPDKDKAVVSPHTHRGDVVRRRQSAAPTLPHGPEYGFLKHVPPNAIRMPGGYIFVPGVGILGESCDLPTSACSNRYRDIQ